MSGLCLCLHPPRISIFSDGEDVMENDSISGTHAIVDREPLLLAKYLCVRESLIYCPKYLCVRGGLEPVPVRQSLNRL